MTRTHTRAFPPRWVPVLALALVKTSRLPLPAETKNNEEKVQIESSA